MNLDIKKAPRGSPKCFSSFQSDRCKRVVDVTRYLNGGHKGFTRLMSSIVPQIKISPLWRTDNVSAIPF